jgi:hypothetical protein
VVIGAIGAIGTVVVPETAGVLPPPQALTKSTERAIASSFIKVTMI